MVGLIGRADDTRTEYPLDPSSMDKPMATPWQEMSAVFQQVFDLPETERRARLDALYPADSTVRTEVESLLRAHDLAEQLTEEGFTVAVERLSASTLDLAPTRQLGPYTILSELGRGGMSQVLLAARTDNAFDRLVAIKTLQATGQADSYERFLTERQVHASLEHPGIARLYGGGTSERGVPFIVMEYIERGRPISVYCDEQSLGAGQRIDLFRRVCLAVAYAHRNLVVHRDLKPNNILVTPEGDPKLLDFGISKLLTPEGSDWDPTGIGPGPLTPSYASPEQILGQPITTASDIFSLGVLLFRLLTGRLPFARSVSERLAEMQEDAPPISLERSAHQTLDEPTDTRPSAEAFLALDRGQRQDLEAILSKALRHEPAERYGSVELMENDLRRWMQGLPVTARLPTLTYRFSRWLRRNWLVASFGMTLLVTLLISSIVLATQNQEMSRERDRAQAEAAKSERILDLMLGLLEGSDPANSLGDNPSVRDVLMAAEPRIDRELAAQPKVQAALFESVGRVFYSLGSLDDAERLLRRAEALWQQTVWPMDSTGSNTLDLLAQIQIRRGHFEQAIAVLEQSRQLRIDDFGVGSVEEAVSLTHISHAHLLLYRVDAAEATARRALEIFDQCSDEGFAEERVDVQFTLGETLYRQRGAAAADGIFEDLLTDAEGRLGSDHPKTLNILGKLAEVKSEQPQQMDLAVSYARQRIAIQQRLYQGEDHPDLALSYDSLAGILARAGYIDETQQAFEESVAMRERLEGDDGPFLAVTLGNLGWFHLFRRQDPVAAEPILRRSLAMAEQYYPPTASLLAYQLIGIGRCRTLAGDAAAGEPYLRRALAIRQAAHGDGALSVSRAELFLGESLASQGRCAEAEPLLQRSRSALRSAAEADDLSRMVAPWETFLENCRADAGPLSDIRSSGEHYADRAPRIRRRFTPSEVSIEQRRARRDHPPPAVLARRLQHRREPAAGAGLPGAQPTGTRLLAP